MFAISDRVTITRNGRDVLTRDCAALAIPEVIEGMIGQQREALFPPPLPVAATTTQARMVVKGLAGGKLADASFDAGSGEVIGLAGLEGSGVSDLLEILFGMRRARGGEVRFPDGKGVPNNSTEAARRNVCMVPADRRRNGLMLDKSILFNISNVIIGARGSGCLWYSPKTALGRANRQITALRIKSLPHALANSLSGGNQQKVVIDKWLDIGPRVFLLDDPTRGVDLLTVRGSDRADRLLQHRLPRATRPRQPCKGSK